MRLGLGLPATLVVLVGCGGEPAPRVADPVTATAPSTAAVPAPPASAPPASTARPEAAAIFARLKPAFDACYEAGKKSTPTMLDGKVTLNASFDESGKVTCALPTAATGLTQQVEDCMSDRLGAETFGRGPAWTEVLPVVLKSGVLALGEREAQVTSLESVETRRMPDAFDVLESLVPRLEACLHPLDRASGIKSIIVAAKVATNGKPQCALASPSTGSLPANVNQCAVDTFLAASFPPPSGGPGAIMVPLNLVGR